MLRHYHLDCHLELGCRKQGEGNCFNREIYVAGVGLGVHVGVGKEQLMMTVLLMLMTLNLI